MNSRPDPYQPRKTSALAVVALVLSCLIFLPLVPLIGSVLGIIALVRLADRPDLGGKGLAIAAIPVGLVVVLFLQGIMAAIAIPTFIKYIRKSKTVEATESLDRLTHAMQSYMDANGSLPRAQTGWVPTTPCCAQASQPKCAPDPAAWRGSPWTELGFTLSHPHYFQYRCTSGPRGFELEARGDLDCDESYSSYKVQGTLAADGSLQVQGPVITDEIE